MDALDSVYDLTNPDKIVQSGFCVHNEFIGQLINLTLHSISNCKVMSVVTNGIISNRGAVKDKGIKLADKAVVNICKLNPLVGIPGAKTVVDEIALYRARQYRLDVANNVDGFLKAKRDYLFYDYLLATCLCYVEEFDGTRVSKYYATKNRFIAAMAAGMDASFTAKYMNYLTMSQSDVSSGIIRALKLNYQTKSGLYKIVQPRSGVTVSNKLKVTPYFIMAVTAESILKALGNGIMRFVFVKDNLQERELVSTMNPQILGKYYDAEHVEVMLAHVKKAMNRGYIQVPELGLSRYDDSGVRALDLTRITDIEFVKNVDTRFIDVDLNSVVPEFFRRLDEMGSDVKTLAHVYNIVFNSGVSKMDANIIRDELESWCRSQKAIGTTTFMKQLHTLMISNPMLFPNYTGKHVQLSFKDTAGFDIGV